MFQNCSKIYKTIFCFIFFLSTNRDGTTEAKCSSKELKENAGNTLLDLKKEEKVAYKKLKWKFRSKEEEALLDLEKKETTKILKSD